MLRNSRPIYARIQKPKTGRRRQLATQISTRSGGRGITTNNRKLIELMTSPGSYASRGRVNAIFPTGGNFNVNSSMMTMTKTLTPDASGRIILLQTGVPEVPLLQVIEGPSGPSRLKAFTFDLYRKDPKYLHNLRVHAYRTVAQSITVENTTNITQMGGTVTAILSRPSYDQKTMLTPNGETIRVLTLDRPPITEGEIAATAGTYHAGVASEGVYQVNKPVDPTMPWTLRDSDGKKNYPNVYSTTANWVTTETGSTMALGVSSKPSCQLFALANDDVIMIPAVWDDSELANVYSLTRDSDGILVDHPSVSFPTNMSVTSCVFSGLDPAAKLTIKVVVAMEFVVKTTSPLYNLGTPMPPLDLKMITAASLAATRTPNVAVAAANSFGSFLKGLTGIFDTVAPIVTTVAKAMPDPRAQGVAEALRLVTNVRNAFGPAPPQQVVYAPPNPTPKTSTSQSPLYKAMIDTTTGSRTVNGFSRRK